MNITTLSLNLRGNGEERTVFIPVMSIVIVILLSRFVKYSRVFGEAVLVGLKSPATGATAPSTSAPATPTGVTSGRYRIKVLYQKAFLSDGTIRGVFDWNLLENNSGTRLRREDRETLDFKVSAFCRHLTEDVAVPVGEHPREEWFN